MRYISVIPILFLSSSVLARSKVGDRFTIRPYFVDNTTSINVAMDDAKLNELPANDIDLLKDTIYESNTPGESGVSFSLYGFSLAYGTPTPVDEESKAEFGETTGDNYLLSFYSERISVSAYYKNIKGFFLSNIDEFNPDYVKGEVGTHLFPDMEVLSAGAVMTFVFNPKDYKIQAVLDQSDIQTKSVWILAFFFGVQCEQGHQFVSVIA